MSFNIVFQKINKLSKIIKNECKIMDIQSIKRKNKIQSSELIYFLLKKLGNQTSYNSTNSNVLSNFHTIVTPECFRKKRNNYSVNQFNNLNNKLLSHIYDNPNERRYIAVDGSQLNISKKLSKSGIPLSKSKDYCTGYISCLYDVNKKIPLNYNFSDNKNERQLLIEQLDYVNKNDVLILDRGYYSKNLVKILNEKGIHYIFRLKENSTLNNENNIIPEYEDLENKIIDEKDNKNKNYIMKKEIKINNKKYSINVVKYTINNNSYYLASDLTGENFTVDKFKELYHDRWSIEVHFRFMKYVTSANNLKSKNKLFILQDLAIIQTIYIITSYIKFLLSEVNKKIKKINKNYEISTKDCIDHVLNKILYQMIFKKSTKKVKLIINKELEIIAKTIYYNVEDRHYEHVRIFPSTKWNKNGNRFGEKPK